MYQHEPIHENYLNLIFSKFLACLFDLPNNDIYTVLKASLFPQLHFCTTFGSLMKVWPQATEKHSNKCKKNWQCECKKKAEGSLFKYLLQSFSSTAKRKFFSPFAGFPSRSFCILVPRQALMMLQLFMVHPDAKLYLNFRQRVHWELAWSCIT